ncbi:hypothetical protein FACS1894122_00400 [Alphaproteobacteria bacterium]|nr:hypothetical protein FACS1894122_00400 [Alphaproteobacteria bacterium]
MDSATKDVLFKLVFGDERNKKMLIHLLNCIIDSKNTPIDCIDIRKSELTPEYMEGKEVRLDVLAKASDKRCVNLDMITQEIYV